MEGGRGGARGGERGNDVCVCVGGLPSICRSVFSGHPKTTLPIGAARYLRIAHRKCKRHKRVRVVLDERDSIYNLQEKKEKCG